MRNPLSAIRAALPCALGIACSSHVPTLAYETNVRTAAPSTIVKSDGVYWIYGTGLGVPQFSSTDKVHWTFRGPALSATPSWVHAAVPDNKNGYAWAPDIRYFHGLWHLYYSESTFGSKRSGIGVATNKTLDPASWVDQGPAVLSDEATSYNAIDPCIVEDAAHHTWLSFGSFFSEIQIVAIDPNTGKQPTTAHAIYSIASRPGTRDNAIEASTITAHDGWYYLFVNWDRCCAGAASSYNIRVGRSKSIMGPYRDKNGVSLQQGGGSMFMASVYDNGTGRLLDDEVGPGHVGILHDTDGDWVSFHEEWAADRHGAVVNLLRLAWDHDGWPRSVRDPGPYSIVSATPGNPRLNSSKTHGRTEASIPMVSGPHLADQQWMLAYVRDGYYRITSTSGALLTRQRGLFADTTPARDLALWYIDTADDGTLRIISGSRGNIKSLSIKPGAQGPEVVLVDPSSHDALQQSWQLKQR